MIVLKYFYFVKMLIGRTISSLVNSSYNALHLFLNVISGNLMMLIVLKFFLKLGFPLSSNRSTFEQNNKTNLELHNLRILTNTQNSCPWTQVMPLQTFISLDQRCLQFVPRSYPFQTLPENLLLLWYRYISCFYPLQVSTQCNLK